MLSQPLVWALYVLVALTSLGATTIVPANSTGNASWPYQIYETANFTPPVLEISGHSDSSEGYFFFAPDGATPFEIAPLIMDSYGELVWNGPKQHAFNFGVQTYQNNPVLVSWNGSLFPEPVGRGNGVVYIWDKRYEQIAEIALPGDFLEQVPNATFPSNIDLHEVYITPKDTILVTANNVTQTDLTSVGGPASGWVVEAQVYEIDIATNKVLFSWKSLDHLDDIPLNASVLPLGAEGANGTSQSSPWGYFHINAVSPYNGGYILSSRFLCSAIALDASGNVAWRLQGRDGGDFTLGNGADFCYQHDIRAVSHRQSEHGTVTLSLFDNHNSPIDNNTVPNSGKVLNVDLMSKHVSLVERYLNDSGPIYATAQGNFQRLPNSNVFIGHGWIPVMEEFTHSGEVLSTIQFGAAQPRPGGGFFSALRPTLSYRSFKQPWVGCPKTKPAVVARSAGGQVSVWISWNGATEVEAWAVYGGNQTIEYLTTVPKNGFETMASVGEVDLVQVKPLLKAGTIPRCGQKVLSDTISVVKA